MAGKCCESGDVLIEEVMLPPCQAGDLLAVYTTGAYGFSMPATTTVCPGGRRLHQGRSGTLCGPPESYADLLRGEDVET